MTLGLIAFAGVVGMILQYIVFKTLYSIINDIEDKVDALVTAATSNQNYLRIVVRQTKESKGPY